MQFAYAIANQFDAFCQQNDHTPEEYIYSICNKKCNKIQSSKFGDDRRLGNFVEHKCCHCPFLTMKKGNACSVVTDVKWCQEPFMQ